VLPESDKYVRGKQHGHFVSYDSDGNRAKQRVYDSGRLVWTGKPDAVVPDHSRWKYSTSESE